MVLHAFFILQRKCSTSNKELIALSFLHLKSNFFFLCSMCSRLSIKPTPLKYYTILHNMQREIDVLMYSCHFLSESKCFVEFLTMEALRPVPFLQFFARKDVSLLCKEEFFLLRKLDLGCKTRYNIIGECMKLNENERIDDLEFNNLKIIQNKKGFCFGIDSVLLSDFAKEVKNGSVGVDLGTGTGIISILLAGKTKSSKIIGVEIQKDVAEMAKRSVELNNLQDKIEIVNCNIKDIFGKNEDVPSISENGFFHKQVKKESKQEVQLQRDTLDFVVTNPPYKKMQTGKVNESEYKYISRHEVTANLEDFIKVSKYLLKDKGALYMVHRPDRLVDIIELMRKYKLEPKRLRFVYSTVDKEPVLILIKGVKNAGAFLKVEKPLIIYREDGEYTDEIYEIYGRRLRWKIETQENYI